MIELVLQLQENLPLSGYWLSWNMEGFKKSEASNLACAEPACNKILVLEPYSPGKSVYTIPM